MKKTALSLIFLLISISFFSQSKIDIDKTSPNGKERVVSMEHERIDTTGYILYRTSIGLSYHKMNNVESYYVSFLIISKDIISIPLGKRLMVKLNNGNIISLKSDNEAIDNIGRYDSILGTYYYASPVYQIKLSQIDNIIQYGVSKLRIETSTSFDDFSFKQDIVGDIFKRQMTVINETKQQKDSFLKDF
ncbi:MAG: hypothetical protein QM660_10760 [Dysgonomonas sp.]